MSVTTNPIEQLRALDPTVTVGTALATCTGWHHPEWNGTAWAMETFPYDVHKEDLGDWRGTDEIVFAPSMQVTDLKTEFIPSARYAGHTSRTVAFPIAAIAEVRRHEWYCPDVWGGRD